MLRLHVASKDLQRETELKFAVSVTTGNAPATSPVIAFSISPGKLLRLLFLIITIVAAASVAAHVYSHVFRERSIFGLIDLEAEGNLSTWFASTLLLATASLLFLIGRISPPDIAGRWKILSVIFLYVAIDEAAQLHEFAIQPLRTAMNLTGLFYFSWVAAAIPILAVLTAYYFRFLSCLPGPVRRTALSAAAVYLAGGLGMEMVNGAHFEQHGRTLTYLLMTDLEESLELVGIALWLFALLRYLELLSNSPALRSRTATAGGGPVPPRCTEPPSDGT